MADPTLYRNVGTEPIDPAAWPDSGKTNAAGEELYTFAGDTTPGEANGASNEWVVDTAAAPSPAPSPKPAPGVSTVTAGPGVPNPGNVPGAGDRVQMLSVRADGTPDQTNPTLIGDRDATLEATKTQLVQQAVAAIDTAASLPTTAGEDEAVQDPGIAAATETHQQVAVEASDRAETLVDELTAAD